MTQFIKITAKFAHIRLLNTLLRLLLTSINACMSTLNSVTFYQFIMSLISLAVVKYFKEKSHWMVKKRTNSIEQMTALAEQPYCFSIIGNITVTRMHDTILYTIDSEHIKRGKFEIVFSEPSFKQYLTFRRQAARAEYVIRMIPLVMSPTKSYTFQITLNYCFWSSVQSEQPPYS